MIHSVTERTCNSGRSCDSCGGRNFGVLLGELSHRFNCNGESREWLYKLLECKSCGLGLIDPKPTWELLQTFYEDSYGSYDSSSRSTAYNASSLKFRIARMRGANISSNSLIALISTTLGYFAELTTGKTVSYTFSIPLQLHKDANIFDVGYGSGNWLLALSEIGYRNLYGYDIEANIQNVSVLIGKGIKVSSGVFLENEYPFATFDCIRLDHVFEHLLDPIEVLKKCRNMLKPGGFLVMSFPCKNSWSLSLSLIDSPALQIPKHLFHHNQQSVRMMLEGAGFIPLRITAYSVSSQLGGTINNILSKHNRRTIPPLLFEIISPIYRLFGTLTGKGDFMTVWAKKPDAPRSFSRLR